MLVDRVVVVHVELHHRDDRFEFRQEGRQHPQLVHPPQGAIRIAVFEHQTKEDPHRFGVAAHVVVDQVEVGSDQPHRV